MILSFYSYSTCLSFAQNNKTIDYSVLINEYMVGLGAERFFFL